MHGTASVFWGLLSPMNLCLRFMGVDFQVGGLLDLEQLVGPDHHFVYFKGAAVLCESEILLCLDDFIAVTPHSMGTITIPPQLGLCPEASLSNVARGPYFLLELLVGSFDSCLLGIWTLEAIPSCWLGTRVSCTLLEVTFWIWLVAILVSIIPTDLNHRISILVYGAPWRLPSHHHRSWQQPWLDWRADWWAWAQVG